ncbi:MAG: hypothetical protein K2L42_04010 [Clostridia bacterium]|nr:hypothetical protein [Clostridia bacterium]
MNFMRYEKLLNALENLSLRGMDFGVERTRAILDALGKPDGRMRIIHIAGTNGKGSVAEYITQILIAAGKRVGTFTSPAVYDYFEQFRIDGKNINLNLFCDAAESVLKSADDATRFEAETATALYAFYLAGCEYAVIECGLGGTYDATNAVLRKKLALITSISLEHTSVLGKTIESIRGHKAGIIKNGCEALISGCNTQETLEYFEKLGATVAGKYDSAPMFGEEQAYNAGLAAEAAKRLGISEAAIYEGIKNTKPGGRLEVIKADAATYILDGAHNPQSFNPLVTYLKKHASAEETSIIFGCLNDKDINSNIGALSGLAKEIIAVECESPRAMKLGKIFTACKTYFSNATAAASVSNALEKASGKTVAVCGSFTLLKEAKNWIEKR